MNQIFFATRFLSQMNTVCGKIINIEQKIASNKTQYVILTIRRPSNDEEPPIDEKVRVWPENDNFNMNINVKQDPAFISEFLPRPNATTKMLPTLIINTIILDKLNTMCEQQNSYLDYLNTYLLDKYIECECKKDVNFGLTMVRIILISNSKN